MLNCVYSLVYLTAFCNGMIGTILSFDNGYFKVCFSDNNKNNDVVAYFNDLYIENYLRLSYVNTIHKYQGSENKIAVILLTDRDKFVISKNMLHTAVSRAKEKCIIISDDFTFDKAFQRKCVRISKLDEMLREQSNDAIVNVSNESEGEKPKKIRTNIGQNKKIINF